MQAAWERRRPGLRLHLRTMWRFEAACLDLDEEIRFHVQMEADRL